MLNQYELLEPANKPKAIELLTQRPMWAKRLLEEIKNKHIPVDALNVNQVRRLLTSSDKELVALVTRTWGTIRTDRDPQRELIVDRMRYFIRRNPGDATRGLAVYTKSAASATSCTGKGRTSARTSRSTAATRSSSCSRTSSIPAWSSGPTIRPAACSPPTAAG